jgi:hypothetical protein
MESYNKIDPILAEDENNQNKPTILHQPNCGQ